jgi:1-acyl-sn-glycerol-3-phosphate acyltransferase
MFFPEGTFTRTPGLLPFHMGAFVAAAEAGVPVVPIALRGTRSILRSGSWFPRRGSISIQIGRPIEPDPAETDAWSRALKLRDLSRQHILRHCGEPDLTQERPPI